MKQALHDKLKQSLDLWIELTGVDPGAWNFTTKLGGGMDDYTVSKMHKAINEALNIDATGITAYLLLDALSAIYFNERSFSMADMLDNPERITDLMTKTRMFRTLVQAPEILAIGDSFALSIRQALRHYGADTPEVLKLIENRRKLAYLRRDALRSMQQLRIDQFLKGVPESESVRPVYNGFVHQFWNINSLINAVCHQPSGVSLNLIRDPDDFQSYFAFAVRNGGNLFILSDVPAHAHPLQRHINRRPYRPLGDHSFRNWFPYELLNIKYDEESGELYVDKSGRAALIPLQQKADRLKALSTLNPVEVIWIVMMFDLIVDRFWQQGYQATELTYTGQMVREEAPLIDSASQARLPFAGYQPLALPALTVADVRHDCVSRSAIGHDGGSPHLTDECYL